MGKKANYSIFDARRVNFIPSANTTVATLNDYKYAIKMGNHPGAWAEFEHTYMHSFP